MPRSFSKPKNREKTILSYRYRATSKKPLLTLIAFYAADGVIGGIGST